MARDSVRLYAGDPGGVPAESNGTWRARLGPTRSFFFFLQDRSAVVRPLRAPSDAAIFTAEWKMCCTRRGVGWGGFSAIPCHRDPPPLSTDTARVPTILQHPARRGGGQVLIPPVLEKTTKTVSIVLSMTALR